MLTNKITTFFHFHHLAVGGKERLGKDGGGLIQPQLRLAVAGADVGEQQLVGTGFGGEAARLSGGEVQPFGGEV